MTAHEGLITALQYVHDHGEIEDWEDHFMAIARRYILVYTPPETPWTAL